MRISDWSSDVCSSDLRRETTQRIAKGARVRSGAIFGHGARRTAFEEIDQIGAERVVAVVSHDERHILDLGKFAIGQSFDEISGIVRRYKLAQRPTDLARRQHENGRATWRERVGQYV